MRLLLLNLLLLLPIGSVFAQGPQQYKSKNFDLRTDLPKEDAEELLEKLETMIGIISKYWAVRNRKQIECFVVADLKNWPANSIDQRAIPSIRSGAGITLADFRRRGSRTSIRAVAYSAARTSVVQHEAVHAYSYYAFGHCGPQWYAEGMAEMGAHWKEGATEVTAPRYVTEYLRRSKPRTVRDITAGETGKVGSWQNYAWRWALCHLLANNTNYATKFRPLGLTMLAKKRGSFSATYGKQLKEMEFEYGFFLKHMEPGFDVGRCSWDWDTRFRKLKPETSTSVTITADKGWQASAVSVEEGRRYKFKATGMWKLDDDADELTADGDGSALSFGRLEGVTMANLQLSEPFPLGTSGEFVAKESGDLYLRCRDKWTSLGNNSGEVMAIVEVVGGNVGK